MKSLFSINNLGRNLLFSSVLGGNLISHRFRMQSANLEAITSKEFMKDLKEGRSQHIIKEFNDIFDFQDHQSLNFLYSNMSQSDQYKEYLNKIESQNAGKDDLEFNIKIGNSTSIENRGFAQFDLYEVYKNISLPSEGLLEPNASVNSEEFDPKRHFSKILVFRIGDKYYATGSFCGYCMQDLKNGVFLGNKITCANCLSEYSVEGEAESGPNSKNLSTFRIGLSDNKLIIRVPKNRLPLFRRIFESSLDGYSDPRHIIIIGETDTSWGALNILRRYYAGKLSIVTNYNSNKYLDFNKLHQSFFPMKRSYASMIEDDFLKRRNIEVYDNKVENINLEKRTVTLDNMTTLPFDKVLIATGCERSEVARGFINCFSLDSLGDHAKIHNFLKKKENSNMAIVGNNLNSFKISSAMRRFLDYSQRENFQVGMVINSNFLIDYLANSDASKILVDYLERNRITVFKDMDVALEERGDGTVNSISKLLLVSKETGKMLAIPVHGVVIEEGLTISKCDFQHKIFVEKRNPSAKITWNARGLFIPQSKFSLQMSNRYAHLFASGSCTALEHPDYSGYINSDNVKTNYDIGLYSAMNMLDINLATNYNIIPISTAQVLDKKLTIIGCDNPKFDRKIVYVDKANERFVSYLILGDTVQSVVTFGYNMLDIYVREAFMLKLMPSPKYIIENLKTVQNTIAETVIKNSDTIVCRLNKHMKQMEKQNIELSEYDNQDQFYAKDLQSRFSELEAEKKRIEKDLQVAQKQSK